MCQHANIPNMDEAQSSTDQHQEGRTMSEMINRPPIQMICYTDAQGNPHTFTVGLDCAEIREVQENGEMAFIPWVEVWRGEKLVARFSQHKLEHIIY